MSTGRTTETPSTVSLGDIDVRYRVAGDGPAVVLVHGLAEDHTSWRRQQDALREFRTHAYDLRGHGGSALGAAEGTPEQLRDDLIAFLAEVSGPAVCVGFSLGGAVVLAAAAERPDLVAGAVVLGTSTVVGRAAASFYAERIGRARSGDRESLAAAMREDTAAALVNPDVDVDEITAGRLAAIGDGAGYANAAAAMATLRERPLTPALPTIRCPVAVIGAEQDTFCPRKAADIVLDGLREGSYHEIPGAGHLMNVDKPEAVTASLLAVLEGNG